MHYGAIKWVLILFEIKVLMKHAKKLCHPKTTLLSCLDEPLLNDNKSQRFVSVQVSRHPSKQAPININKAEN